MNNITKELTNLIEQVDEAKQKVSVLRGREEESLKRLKEELGSDSVEKASKWLGKEETDIEKIDKDITQKFEELKENYAW